MSQASESDIEMNNSDVEETPEIEEEEKVDPLVGSGVTDDVYLMEEAEYIKKETRWRNKQRTLVFGSRGISGRHRHLLEDFKRMMPHHKSEPKFEKKSSFTEINEICELKSCNNAVFLESRRHGNNVSLYVARVPHGPTMKFGVLNIHTSQEVNLSGNCLLGSRPLLSFDKMFDENPHRRLMKEMLGQAFGVPRNHPKCKPFYDHILSFYWLDEKIWVRHFQISPTTPEDANDPENQELTEIGPRFVLDPVMIQDGSFGGKVIYSNPNFHSKTAKGKVKMEEKMKKYRDTLLQKQKRAHNEATNQLPDDPLADVFE